MIVQTPSLNLTGTDPFPGWHRETTPIKAYPPKGAANIFLIGAYSGTIASLLIEQEPKVEHYLFEPQDWACKTLREKFGHLPNVHVCQFGLGDRTGIFQMGLYGSYDCTFVRGPTPLKNIPGSLYDANLKEFAEFMAESKLESVWYASINIEGYEYVLLPHLLKTDWLKKIQVLGISWHDASFNCPVPGPYTWLGDALGNWVSMQKILTKTHELVLFIDNWQTWVRK